MTSSLKGIWAYFTMLNGIDVLGLLKVSVSRSVTVPLPLVTLAPLVISNIAPIYVLMLKETEHRPNFKLLQSIIDRASDIAFAELLSSSLK